MIGVNATEQEHVRELSVEVNIRLEAKQRCGSLVSVSAVGS